MLNAETQVGWQDYVAIVVRRRWYFLVPCVAIVSIAVIVGFFLPKIFRAKTILLMQDPKIMNPLIQGIAVSSPLDVRMRVVQEELLGWTSLSRLVHELGMDRGVQSPVAFEGLIKGLRNNITVKMSSGSLITLTYDDPNPELARRVLNTVTSIYIQRNVESQTAEAESAISFIEREMTGYKTKLEESEQTLREFKELYLMEMPVAKTLNNQIINLQVALAQLLVDNTEEHPTVVQIRRQIAELKQQRNEEIKRVVASAIAKSQTPEIYQDLVKSIDIPTGQAPANPAAQVAKEAYQSWVERMDNSASPSAGEQSMLQVITPAAADGTVQPVQVVNEDSAMALTLGPRQEQELARLKRGYEMQRKTYNDMEQRLERARVTQRLGESDEGTKFKIIEPARLPLRPVSPNLWLIFSGALAGGAFVGICAAFGAEYLDQSFQSAEDVQAALALPVIGSISTIVTPADAETRQRRYKSWVSPKSQTQWLKAHVLAPVWSCIDQVLLRWGL